MRPILRCVSATSTLFAKLSAITLDCGLGFLSILLTSNFGVNFGAGRTNITTGVDVNELILELAFSPVQDPIPLNLKKRNSVT